MGKPCKYPINYRVGVFTSKTDLDLLPFTIIYMYGARRLLVFLLQGFDSTASNCIRVKCCSANVQWSAWYGYSYHRNDNCQVYHSRPFGSCCFMEWSLFATSHQPPVSKLIHAVLQLFLHFEFTLQPPVSKINPCSVKIISPFWIYDVFLVIS